MYIKNIVFFFMEGIHSTTPSVKMADAVASYIFNYKFQFKFSLRIEIVNLNEKS